MTMVHFISQAKLLIATEHWIRPVVKTQAVERLPLTSADCGLTILSCRDRWQLIILYEEALMQVKKLQGYSCVLSELGWTLLCSWLVLTCLFQ